MHGNLCCRQEGKVNENLEAKAEMVFSSFASHCEKIRSGGPWENSPIAQGFSI